MIYLGYLTKLDRRIQKELKLPVRKKIGKHALKKATVSMSDMEQFLEQIADFLQKNNMDQTMVSFSLERTEEESRNGETTLIDFEIPISVTDVGKSDLLPDKLAIDISSDENVAPEDLEIPGEVANEIHSESEDEVPPYEATFGEPETDSEPEPKADDSVFEDLGEEKEDEDLGEDADEDVFDFEESEELDQNSDSTTSEPEPSDPEVEAETNTEQPEPPDNNSNGSSQPETDQLINLGQYLAGIEGLNGNGKQITLDRKQILAGYGLPENRSEINSEDVVLLAKYDFLSECLGKQNADLDRWNNELTSKQEELIADLRQKLIDEYRQIADSKQILATVDQQINEVVQIFNKDVLQPSYATANKEIAAKNQAKKQAIDQELEAEKATAIQKLEAEARLKIDESQTEYENSDSELINEMQQRASNYRSEQEEKIQGNVRLEVNQTLVERKNSLISECKKQLFKLTDDYLVKLSQLQKKICSDFEQNKDQFEINAVQKRKVELEDRKSDREWAFRNKQLDSKVEIAKSKNEMAKPQVVANQTDNQTDFEYYSKMHKSMFDDVLSQVQQISNIANTANAKPVAVSMEPTPKLDSNHPVENSEEETDSDSKPKIGNKKSWINYLLAIGGVGLVLGGGITVVSHENAKINQLSSTNSQLVAQMQRLEQKQQSKSSQNKVDSKKLLKNKTQTQTPKASTPEPKPSLEELLNQKDYQKAMDNYHDTNSLDQIAQRMYVNQNSGSLKALNDQYNVPLGKYNHAILTNDQTELQSAARQLTTVEKAMLNSDQQSFLQPGK